MKIGEFVANQKELAMIVALIAGLGGAQGAMHYLLPSDAPPPVAVTDTLVLHATRALSQDVAALSVRQTATDAKVDALVRVECILNRRQWRDFALAGIRCQDLVATGAAPAAAGGTP